LTKQSLRELPIAPEGIQLTIIFGVLSAIFMIAGAWKIGIILLVCTAFNLYFFRNPDRHSPEGNVVVAPADGRIIVIKPVLEKRFFKEEVNKISIFMNVFNVHVNRMPYDGEVLEVAHEDGKFLSADLDAAAEENEKNSVFVKTPAGFNILFVQVAGLIARRIICYVKKGDLLKRSERFGLICYGSRVDIFLPKSVEIKVKIGDKTTAGETVIGEIKND
jgi:phosphatidylserine decarboxylase